jgi:hypothetical protein
MAGGAHQPWRAGAAAPRLPPLANVAITADTARAGRSALPEPPPLTSRPAPDYSRSCRQLAAKRARIANVNAHRRVRLPAGRGSETRDRGGRAMPRAGTTLQSADTAMTVWLVGDEFWATCESEER